MCVVGCVVHRQEGGRRAGVRKCRQLEWSRHVLWLVWQWWTSQQSVRLGDAERWQQIVRPRDVCPFLSCAIQHQKCIECHMFCEIQFLSSVWYTLHVSEDILCSVLAEQQITAQLLDYRFSYIELFEDHTDITLPVCEFCASWFSCFAWQLTNMRTWTESIIIMSSLATLRAPLHSGSIHLFICLSVCLSVCMSVTKMHKEKHDFLKTKQFRAVVFMTTYRKSYMSFSKNLFLYP